MALGMFLRLDGIEGGSRDAVHASEIGVESWSFAVGGPGFDYETTGVPNSLELIVYADAATPKLFVQCLAGGLIPSGEITVRAGSGVEIFVVKMEGVTIARLGATARHSDNQPTAMIHLDCQRVGGIYTPQTPDASPGVPVGGGWDLSTSSEWDPMFPRSSDELTES